MPALKKALESDNPEIRGRAQRIEKEIKQSFLKMTLSIEIKEKK